MLAYVDETAAVSAVVIGAGNHPGLARAADGRVQSCHSWRHHHVAVGRACDARHSARAITQYSLGSGVPCRHEIGGDAEAAGSLNEKVVERSFTQNDLLRLPKNVTT